MLSKQLKKARKKYKLTLRQAADALGVPEGTYYNWEAGRNKPSLEKTKEVLKHCRELLSKPCRFSFSRAVIMVLFFIFLVIYLLTF